MPNGYPGMTKLSRVWGIRVPQTSSSTLLNTPHFFCDMPGYAGMSIVSRVGPRVRESYTVVSISETLYPVFLTYPSFVTA